MTTRPMAMVRSSAVLDESRVGLEDMIALPAGADWWPAARRRPDSPRDLLPTPWNARPSMLHHVSAASRVSPILAAHLNDVPIPCRPRLSRCARRTPLTPPSLDEGGALSVSTLQRSRGHISAAGAHSLMAIALLAFDLIIPSSYGDDIYDTPCG